jgi:hypothetical protein
MIRLEKYTIHESKPAGCQNYSATVSKLFSFRVLLTPIHVKILMQKIHYYVL